MELEHAKLRADVEIVRGYGETHAEAWVGLRFENEPSVRIVALFAGSDLRLHEDALRRMVSYPDQLELRPSPWPQTRLNSIRDEVRQMATSAEMGLFSGWGGTSQGRLEVSLRADGEPVAAQLKERYGDAIDITVGYLHYPDCQFSGLLGQLFANSSQRRPEVLPDAFRVALEDPLEVRSGANSRGAMRLINDGPAEVVVQTNGQVTAVVIDPETDEVVGGYSGAQALPLVGFSAPAGGSVDIPVLVGTASTMPRLGYAVPPGRWALEITLGFADTRHFRTPPLPLTVVP
jgi:hypothetical protein